MSRVDPCSLVCRRSVPVNQVSSVHRFEFQNELNRFMALLPHLRVFS